MSTMTNDAYRKSRGTDKPFSGTEEQANAVWNEFIRREKWKSAKVTPTPTPAPASTPAGKDG